MRETVILSAIRTPVGSFRGSLASVSATKLGSIAASGAIQSAKLKPQQIQEVFFGHVNAANCGQAPAAQAARGADIPVTVSCTGVNKVCASGLKAVMLGSQSIQLGHQDIVLAGGMVFL